MNKRIINCGLQTAIAIANSVLVYSGQELVSHLRIIERSLNFDGKDVLACGIGGVMTAPGHHGRGFASMALRESDRIIFDEISADIGVLLCLPHLVPFYMLSAGGKLSNARWR